MGTRIEWTRLGHIFRHSYYVYQYATGLLIATGLVHQLIDTKELPLNKYYQFLEAGSSKKSMELLNDLGVDFKDGTIFKNGFCVLKDDIDEFEHLIVSEKE